MKSLGRFVELILNIIIILISITIVFAFSYIFQTRILNKDFPNIFNHTAFEVISGSMSPTINIGDAIIVKLTEDVKEGDIIVFKEGNDFITHRLISINGYKAVTKGDANNSIDQEIDISRIIGKVTKIIPNITGWKKLLSTPVVLIAIISTFLIIGMVFPSIKKKKTDIAKVKVNKHDEKNPLKEMLDIPKENKEVLEEKKIDNVIEEAHKEETPIEVKEPVSEVKEIVTAQPIVEEKPIENTIEKSDKVEEPKAIKKEEEQPVEKTESLNSIEDKKLIEEVTPEEPKTSNDKEEIESKDSLNLDEELKLNNEEDDDELNLNQELQLEDVPEEDSIKLDEELKLDDESDEEDSIKLDQELKLDDESEEDNLEPEKELKLDDESEEEESLDPEQELKLDDESDEDDGLNLNQELKLDEESKEDDSLDVDDELDLNQELKLDDDSDTDEDVDPNEEQEDDDDDDEEEPEGFAELERKLFPIDDSLNIDDETIEEKENDNLFKDYEDSITEKEDEDLEDTFIVSTPKKTLKKLSTTKKAPVVQKEVKKTKPKRTHKEDIDELADMEFDFDFEEIEDFREEEEIQEKISSTIKKNTNKKSNPVSTNKKEKINGLPDEPDRKSYLLDRIYIPIIENIKDNSINKKKTNKATKKEKTKPVEKTRPVERTKGPKTFVISKTNKLLNNVKEEPKKETKSKSGPITYTVKKHKRNKQ